MVKRAVAASSRESTTTRDLILDAAERRFADGGFAGVSTRAIAADAGLGNQASLYHHFRDKVALYEAVLERGLEPIVALVARSADASAAPVAPAVVDGVLDGLLDYLEAHPHLPRLIQRAALDDVGHLRALLARVLRPLYVQGLRVLETAPWQPAELPHVAAGIFHLIFGYFADTALLELVVQEDPASRAALARQREFLKRAIAELLGLAPVRRVARSPRRRV